MPQINNSVQSNKAVLGSVLQPEHGIDMSYKITNMFFISLVWLLMSSIEEKRVPSPNSVRYEFFHLDFFPNCTLVGRAQPVQTGVENEMHFRRKLRTDLCLFISNPLLLL